MFEKIFGTENFKCSAQIDAQTDGDIEEYGEGYEI